MTVAIPKLREEVSWWRKSGDGAAKHFKITRIVIIIISIIITIIIVIMVLDGYGEVD